MTPGTPLRTTPRTFRDYERSARDSVSQFYRDNHRYQTVAFVREKHAAFLPLRRQQFSVMEALDYLNTLVDGSDPDLRLDQRQHLLQTAEAMRSDGQPDWMVLTGFLHDLGKVLCLMGEPQWAVVGDTFPVGCRFDPAVVHHRFFNENPDSRIPEYTTTLGIYEAGCGFDDVLMSWGHDEYLYHVLKDYLPVQAAYVIRYHSFYAWHQKGAYAILASEIDRERLPWLQQFSRYDLYSKSAAIVSWEQLCPYYEALIDRFLPARIQF